MRYIKTLILFVISVALLIVVGSSCKKENGEKSVAAKTNALIIYTGPIAADGCGWLVKIDSSAYYAENLPLEYQKNNLAVDVSYEKISSGFQCGLDPKNILPSIHITNIVKSSGQ